jgi:uncharacterized protein YndB with AHSA1/START domain
MTSAIHQEVDFKAAPQKVYDVLTQADGFSKFTGLPAEIEGKSGGSFKCFGGQITGRFIELVPGERIVQAWHVAMWPEGVYSIVKLELRPQGGGTHLVLDHAGFPEEHREHLDAGWPRMYWEPLTKYFGQ